MKNEDLQKLKELAEKVPGHPGEWPFHLNAFHAAASPAVVLKLIAIAEKSIDAEHQAAGAMSDEQIERVIRDVAELPDRDSPLDQPEMMLVSAEELRAILAAAKPVQDPPSQQPVGQPELTVWEGSMPESNGKSNFTAVLYRKDAKGFDMFTDGFTIARSEYPDRVRYEADCVRFLIGELTEKPWITDYDADKHSGYVAPQAPVADSLQPEMLAFLKEFMENSYEQDVGGGDLVVTTCEAREKAVALLKSIEGPSKHKRWCNGDPANCVNNEGHGCPCEPSAAPLNKAGSEVGNG